MHDITIAVLGNIPEIDAGMDLSFKVRVSCPPPGTLEGSPVRILDGEGGLIAEAVLLGPGDGGNETEPFRIKAPVSPGVYTWTALFPAQEAADPPQDEARAAFSFRVKPHHISLSAWGIPSPASRGEKCTVKIGAACSSGCSLAGLPLIIEDPQGGPLGGPLAAGKLGETILDNTTNTYWTAQEFTAPAADGVYSWTARCPVEGLELPHEAEAITFHFRTAPAPEHQVSIEVSGENDHLPVRDAIIMVGLHQASTDKQGRAELTVPGGKQDVSIIHPDYIPYLENRDITGDLRLPVRLVYLPLS
ncbi:MAG: hypothetical protein LBT11_00375 [Treponema sp.]|jgi:hypothetical protein|nr:hypothetical protein [Treponema sp.]